MLKGTHAMKPYNSPVIERLPKIEQPDHILITMDEPLTDEQQFYLLHHRSEKRSALARKLGISKFRLNYQLQKLG